MGKINWVRVLLGGLLAGVILNIFDWVVNGMVLKHQWEAAMQALGRPMPKSAMAVFVVCDFILGIGAIWIYALARPRLGPGPKTALLIGLGYWVLISAVSTAATGAMGLFPCRLLIIGTVAGLVAILVASVAGALVYKE
ncbi:MAG: hypothetical protein ABSF92_06700 [Candidatus Acidiferrales bacterium]